jgi:arginine utilization protein RocB
VVLTLGELEKRLGPTRGFTGFKQGLLDRLQEQVRAGRCTLPDATIQYLKAMTERAAFPGPAVVLGISPPYYPAVSNTAIAKDVSPYLEGLDKLLRTRHASRMEFLQYRASITDLSYTSCADPEGERRLLDNVALAPALYDVPVERIAQLNIPVLAVGPAGRDFHRVAERVYLPDVTGRIPDVVAAIIDRV